MKIDKPDACIDPDLDVGMARLEPMQAWSQPLCGKRRCTGNTHLPLARRVAHCMCRLMQACESVRDLGQSQSARRGQLDTASRSLKQGASDGFFKQADLL